MGSVKVARWQPELHICLLYIQSKISIFRLPHSPRGLNKGPGYDLDRGADLRACVTNLQLRTPKGRKFLASRKSAETGTGPDGSVLSSK